MDKPSKFAYSFIRDKMTVNTNKPSQATRKLLQEKMIIANRIQKEALDNGGENLGELLDLQIEIKELSNIMMSYVKKSLINKIIKQREQYV